MDSLEPVCPICKENIINLKSITWCKYYNSSYKCIFCLSKEINKKVETMNMLPHVDYTADAMEQLRKELNGCRSCKKRGK